MKWPGLVSGHNLLGGAMKYKIELNDAELTLVLQSLSHRALQTTNPTLKARLRETETKVAQQAGVE